MSRPGLTAVGYSTAVMLVVVPLGEAMAAVMPMAAGSAQWRFGAVGLFSRALLLALAGAVMSAYIASTNEHRRTLRTIAVLSGIASALLLAVAGTFAMDALEMSSRVTGVAQRAFRIASVNALVKLVAVCVVTAMLARSGWKASRSSSRHRHERSQPVLVPHLASRPAEEAVQVTT